MKKLRLISFGPSVHKVIKVGRSTDLQMVRPEFCLSNLGTFPLTCGVSFGVHQGFCPRQSTVITTVQLHGRQGQGP